MDEAIKVLVTGIDSIQVFRQDEDRTVGLHMDERLETPKQLAERVGVTEQKIRRLIKTMAIEHVLIGSRVMFLAARSRALLKPIRSTQHAKTKPRAPSTLDRQTPLLLHHLDRVWSQPRALDRHKQPRRSSKRSRGLPSRQRATRRPK